ncbi:MAG: PqiC family protein [Candidatus Adiutrix sp.]|jgi:uncharacterized lipoprotein YmbA|nr:PqiC family protein [Candidatus Adiutrix sp.]
MKQWLTPLLVMLAVLALCACLSQAHPQKNFFALEAAIPEARADLSRKTLLVGVVSAAAGYDGRALVYRLGPQRFDTDFYNEFTAPPARLLADQAAQYLDAASRRVRAVKTAGLVTADFGLETYLEAMHGDFSIEPPQAVLSIRFTVNDLRRPQAKVLLDKTYRRAAPLAARTPEALAAALSGCLSAVLAELNSDIDKNIR